MRKKINYIRFFKSLKLNIIITLAKLKKLKYILEHKYINYFILIESEFLTLK
jgi:hypothetical protein